MQNLSVRKNRRQCHIIYARLYQIVFFLTQNEWLLHPSDDQYIGDGSRMSNISRNLHGDHGNIIVQEVEQSGRTGRNAVITLLSWKSLSKSLPMSVWDSETHLYPHLPWQYCWYIIIQWNTLLLLFELLFIMGYVCIIVSISARGNM